MYVCTNNVVSFKWCRLHFLNAANFRLPPWLWWVRVILVQFVSVRVRVRVHVSALYFEILSHNVSSFFIINIIVTSLHISVSVICVLVVLYICWNVWQFLRNSNHKYVNQCEVVPLSNHFIGLPIRLKLQYQNKCRLKTQWQLKCVCIIVLVEYQYTWLLIPLYMRENLLCSATIINCHTYEWMRYAQMINDIDGIWFNHPNQISMDLSWTWVSVHILIALYTTSFAHTQSLALSLSLSLPLP